MSKAAPFGRLAAEAPSAVALVALERDAGKAGLFADLDDLLGEVLMRALTGTRIVTVTPARPADAVSLDGLDSTRDQVLTDRFLLANQRARGAWFLPESASLKVGVLSFPATFAAYPRFASGLVWDERARVDLRQSAAGSFMWSVLEPFFQQLYVPFELRGRLVGTKSREDQLAAWETFDDLRLALEVDLSEELAVMRYGGGWGRLRSAEQLAAKQRLLAALATVTTPDFAALYRAHRLQLLIARYYEEAAEGRTRRKQVLTRPLQKTLSGFFAGDWLGFLEYLGEPPHPQEEITTAIPQTRLFVKGTKTAAAIAAEKGLPASEVEHLLASYWYSGGQRAPEAASPVEERVQVLVAYWRAFDDLHTRQAPGMQSLWGLVEEARGIHIGPEGPPWYHPRLYRELLPTQLIEDIERLWGSIMLPRWPERIVSEISPHTVMTETFGPALKLWQGCALTAWFLTEGPASRTDMAGLRRYHEHDMVEMQRLGCPIDPAMFAELHEAQSQQAFEPLHDIITRHRRAWAEQFLDRYLRARWEAEFREAARLHAQAIADRGKPPTAKQFARQAAAATNHWLGGDIAALYAALGETSPIHPERVTRMPKDRRGYALLLFQRLGGRPWEPGKVGASPEEIRAEAADWDRHSKLAWLAAQSLRVIQLEEAIGEPPNLKQFGLPGFEYRSDVLADDPDAAWQRYVSTVRATLAVCRATDAPGSATPAAVARSHDASPPLMRSGPAAAPVLGDRNADGGSGLS